MNPKIMTTSKVKLTSKVRGCIPPGSQPSDVVYTRAYIKILFKIWWEYRELHSTIKNYEELCTGLSRLSRVNLGLNRTILD